MKKVKFTLVELLVALLIIGILATIVASGSEFVSMKMKESKTKSQIQRLELALEEYMAEYDFYYMPCEVSGGNVKYFDEPREFNPNPAPGAISTKDVLLMDQGMAKFCSRSENIKSSAKNGKKYISKTFLGEDYTWSDPSAPLSVRKKLGMRDGWGNLLMYCFPGKHNKTKFDIWSRGADGEGLQYTDSTQSEEDDITNWKLQK